METKNSRFDNIQNLYDSYNPVVQYVIKPTLRLVDAHNHPLRRGIAAAVSSGIAHYGLLELIAQASDHFLGTTLKDPETKVALFTLPWYVHFTIGINIFSNIGIGIAKYYQKNEKYPHLNPII